MACLGDLFRLLKNKSPGFNLHSNWPLLVFMFNTNIYETFLYFRGSLKVLCVWLVMFLMLLLYPLPLLLFF